MTSGWMLAPNVLEAFQRLLGADVVLEAWVRRNLTEADDA